MVGSRFDIDPRLLTSHFTYRGCENVMGCPREVRDAVKAISGHPVMRTCDSLTGEEHSMAGVDLFPSFGQCNDTSFVLERFGSCLSATLVTESDQKISA